MSEAHDHSEPRETLWITDAELIRRIGVPEKIARANLRLFDRDRGKGFPQKNPLWGGRRYWPAVKAYFDKQNGLKVVASHGRQSHD